jgi:glycosyltransferase involved in cell wall biosynthesis
MRTTEPQLAPVADTTLEQPQLSVVIPCLDEAQTIGNCVRKAQASLRQLGITGEVVVADNGSQAIAAELGARVLPVTEPGYGSALTAGIAAAPGRWVIIGDANDSYDFSELEPFVAQL